MPYPEINRRSALGVKVQATPGTAESIAYATDAILALEPPRYEEVYVEENPTDDLPVGTLGSVNLGVPSGRCGRITATLPLFGKGSAYADTAGNRGHLHPVLLGMGYAFTLVTQEAHYLLAAYPNTYLTVEVWEAGKLKKIRDAQVERARISCRAGSFAVLEVAFIGAFVSETETAMVSPTLPQIAFPNWIGTGSLAISGATGLIPRSFALDLGLGAVHRGNANGADGSAGYQIVRRRPSIEIVAETLALSSWNPKADKAARTSRTIDVSVGATLAAFSKVNVDIDNARCVDVQEQEDAGLEVLRATYSCDVGTGVAVECGIKLQ